MFGPNRDEVTRGWRKLHNEKLDNLYEPVKGDEMGRACSTNEDKMNACRILMEKPEGKRPLGRLRRRWWIILKWI
jgi:hypothetical protein